MQQYHKSPGEIRLKPGVTVPRCTSHCFAFLKNVSEHASGHQRNKNVTILWVHNKYAVTYILYKQKTNWIGVKGSDEEETVKKILLTDVAEQIKPVYKTNCSRKKNSDRRTPTSVPKKVFANREKPFSRKRQGQADLGQKQVEKVYRRTPPYLTYIGDSIDQGATRLGGL